MPKGHPQGEASAASLAAQRRRVAEEYISEIQALADCMVGVLGTGLIRAKLGRERALRVLKLSGRDSDRIASDWERSEPMRRQVSEVRPAQGYDRDPRHDPRVVKAILSGAPFSEINELIKLVTDELLANPPRNIGPPGSYPDSAPDTGIPMGVSTEVVQGPNGPVRRPVQRSTGYRPWESFPDHQPGAMSVLRPDPAPPGGYWAGSASVTECDHNTGKPYCAACGAKLQPATIPGGTP